MPLDKDGYPEGWTGPKDTEESTVGDWFKGFGWSALESLPELVGVTPSTETREWRQDHPVGGFMSEMLGTAAPYVGWFKAAKAIKPIANLASGLRAGTPFLGGALATAAELAPFEAGRIGASQVNPWADQSFSDMLGSGAVDLALGSGIGGLLHGIAAAGSRGPKLKTIFPGLDVSLPLPLMARQMQEIIASRKLTGDDLGRAQGALKKTLAEARGEVLFGKQEYVGPIGVDSLQPGAKPSEVKGQLNRLFRMQDAETNIIKAQKYTLGTETDGFRPDFESEAAWQLAGKKAGLPDDFFGHGQYFRNISFRKDTPNRGIAEGMATSKAISEQIHKTLASSMESVAPGNWMAREADDGMFVLARKYEGSNTKGGPDDKWVIFKTDQPGYFLPGDDLWAKVQIANAKWLPQQELASDAGPVYNAMAGFMKNWPFHDWAALIKHGPGTIASVLPQNITSPTNETVQRVGEAIREYLSPKMYRYRGSSRANWADNVLKFTFDAASTTADELMRGKVGVDVGKKTLFSDVSGKTTGIDGLTPVGEIWKVPDSVKDEFVQKILYKISPGDLDKEMLAGNISPEAAKVGKNLAAVADWLNVKTQDVEKAVGRRPSEFNPEDYGLKKTWEGDTRFLIKDESGKLVAQAGGANRREAQKAAEQLIKENPTWNIDQEISLSQKEKPIMTAQELAKRIREATSLAERQDLRGYKWDLKTPTTRQLLEDYDRQIRRRLNYQAGISIDDGLSPQLTKLVREEPHAFKLITQTMKDYAGVPSELGKWQNDVVDSVLGPMLGENSASKIVSATSTGMFNFVLGALKTAYPAINMAQFIQTGLPEAAFVLGKSLPEHLAPDYSIFAAGGTKGPVGSMGVLSPLKVAFSAIREMARPSDELREAIARAANERVIEPRAVENWLGPSAVGLGDLRTAFSSGRGLVDWLRALSEWMPTNSERLSRTHAFTTGYKMARDYLHAKDGGPLSADQLFQFAREFTEKSMYLYNTADKSRVFTTPAGSLMGLFKNWQMHYMASMLDYAKQGLTQNNWAPLMWQLGGTMGLGGLAAMPIYGAANSFYKLWSDKSLLQLSYEHFDQNADWVLYGLPALMDMAMTSSVDTPALSNPVRDGSSLFSVAVWGRMQSLSAAAKAAFDNWQTTGKHPGTDRVTRDELVKAFAPVTVYRSLAAFSNPDAIVSASTGYPLMKDPSFVQRLLYAQGFTPVELQRGYDVSQALYETHDALKSEEDKLAKSWAQAEMNGDSESMGVIMRQAMVWGVDVSRVMRAGMKEIDKYRKDIIERRLRPRDIGAYMKVIQGGEE